jgi:hypothetical protein
MLRSDLLVEKQQVRGGQCTRWNWSVPQIDMSRPTRARVWQSQSYPDPGEKELAMINLKRAYDPATSTDGIRLLVERLWPSGCGQEE